MSVRPIPEGYHTITPFLVVPDADRQIQFLEQAFGAKVLFCLRMSDGAVAHAELQIGDSRVMMGQSGGKQPAIPCMLHLYVEDVDAVYKQAIAAGATAIREPEMQFYGDRSGGVKDEAGNQWWIGTHVEDVSAEELERRMAAQG
jgi:PhnB protein